MVLGCTLLSNASDDEVLPLSLSESMMERLFCTLNVRWAQSVLARLSDYALRVLHDRIPSAAALVGRLLEYKGGAAHS